MAQEPALSVFFEPGIRIIPTAEEYVESFNRALGIIARERKYIGYIDTPPMEESRALVRNILAGGGVQVLAVDEHDEVVGWCDIQRFKRDGFRHAGHMGMGLLPHMRGRGLGERLLSEAIALALGMGMERIELEVFETNTRAMALYRKLGFVQEGLKRHARKLDGKYDDDVIMALVVER